MVQESWSGPFILKDLEQKQTTLFHRQEHMAQDCTDKSIMCDSVSKYSNQVVQEYKGATAQRNQ